MLATQVEAYKLQLYIQSASLTLLYYDYALTFPDEKEYIWGSRFTLSTFLYIWCRYALVANIIFLLAFLDLIGDDSCDKGYLISGVLSIIGRACILGVWGLRTYALFRESKIIMVWFAILGLVSFVSDAIQVAGNRCQGNIKYLISGKVLGIAVCCFEFSATILTIIKCFKILQEVKGALAWRKTLAYFLLEQGILYTVTVWGFLVAATVLNFLYSEGVLRRLLSPLLLPISGMMTARFLLRLRKRDREAVIMPAKDDLSRLEFASHSSFNSPGISSIVAEFGEDPERQRREIALVQLISAGDGSRTNVTPYESNGWDSRS